MSKYNLIDIHEDILKESMGRGGTITDSFYNIANIADELDGNNEGKDTYPIEVKRLGPSGDDKVTEEIVIRFGEGSKDYFSIYDYKFGEDPTSEDNYQKEYPFSIGIPTGGKDSLRYAMKLGFKVDGMPKSDDEMGDDEKEDFYLNIDSVDDDMNEVKAHFDRFK
tara:strand:+ start:284 stop:778 length:495 start_codon:yes stop_codon:yes gene_type:complete